MTHTAGHLRPLHLALAIAVMAVWGSNFVVIKHALVHFPPLTFAALRFAGVFLPAVLFLKRPAASWRNLAAYGVLIGAGQFGALFIALRGQITPGLASLMMQAQVFITIGLSVWLTGERLRRVQMIALVMAVGGLGLIGVAGGGSITPLGFVLIAIAASSWAGGNIVARAAGRVDMLAYVVWSSVFAVPPLVALALIVDGPIAIAQALQVADSWDWGALGWQIIANSMFGYGVWGWLLARHPAATIAPLALLIPVFGLASAALFLGEPLQAWKLAAAALVIGGVAVGAFGPGLRAAATPTPKSACADVT